MTPQQYLEREVDDKESLKAWLEDIKQFSIHAKARECMTMLDAILAMKARDHQVYFATGTTAPTKGEHVAFMQGMKVAHDIIKTVLKEEEKDDG